VVWRHTLYNKNVSVWRHRPIILSLFKSCLKVPYNTIHYITLNDQRKKPIAWFQAQISKVVKITLNQKPSRLKKRLQDLTTWYSWLLCWEREKPIVSQGQKSKFKVVASLNSKTLLAGYRYWTVGFRIVPLGTRTHHDQRKNPIVRKSLRWWS
jgi:hypothetical protein